MPSGSETDFDHKSQGNLSEMKENNGNMCSICKKNPPKYKCPKCFTKTCSLPCVKQHKVLNECDGVRCKTAFVPMSIFNESHMLSDYRLLEEIARCCDNHEREQKKTLPTTTKWMNIQKREARNMNIHLELLPYTFTRHKLNSTFFNMRTKSFSWHVTWHFPFLNLSVQRQKIPDAKILSDAVLECCEMEKEINPKIQIYADMQKFCVYMKRVDLPANKEKYHKIDPSLTIKQSLQGKVIIEFPQFIVSTLEEAESFDEKVSEEPCQFQTRPREFNKHDGHRRGFQQRGKFKHKRRPCTFQRNKTEASPQKQNLAVQKMLFDHSATESFP